MAELTPTTGKEILDRVQAIKGGTDKEILKERNRATIAGGITGVLLGIYFGSARGGNVLVTGAIGGVVGALAVRVVMPKADA
jgi:hypothetical protein